MSIESIFKQFNKEICNNCSNREKCQEELRIRLDGSIKCEKYEPKPVGTLIRAVRIGD